VAALSEEPHRCRRLRADEDVGALRRAVAALAAGCAGVDAADAALVATELATNLVRHADPGGYVLFRRAGEGLELLALDRGPGMPVELQGRATSAAGLPPRAGAGGRGLGVGLSSVMRMATSFDLYSRRPGGTAVLARLGAAPPVRWCRWGAVNIPLPHEHESGDRWSVGLGDSVSALVVDGLGHGPEAAAAAVAAVSAFGTAHAGDPLTYLRRANDAMRGTRGGVLGVASIDPGRDELRYSGVGNVSARVVLGSTHRHLVSLGGTLGTHEQAPHARSELVRWERGSTLVLASDGVRSSWDAGAYDGLFGHDPLLVAAVLQRDHGRGNDDATVLVVEDTRSAR
jgi:anti-sigma regulatory factor (Ser/Thr protein kinase)